MYYVQSLKMISYSLASSQHLSKYIAQICMAGITRLANEAASPTPDLSKPEHILILYSMHLCVKIDMHDLMYTCGLHVNQRKELFVIHGTNFPITVH